MAALELDSLQRPARALDVAWRVVAIALAYTFVARVLGLVTGPRPSLEPEYLQLLAINLVSGAVVALVFLPLARRLPFDMATRFVAVFVPLYWIGIVSNLVEAAVDTTLPPVQLAAAAIIFAIPYAVTGWLIVLLLRPSAPRSSTPELWQLLGWRSIRSWAWRTLVAGVLFAVGVEVLGLLWGPLISKYYHDPAYVAQVQTVTPPDYIAGPEEFLRGVVFVLVLLPVLAVMRGRNWPELLRTAAYIALIDAALESWLPMLSMTSYPLGFRIGEGLDLTSDAIVRGLFVAALLAFPVTPGATTTPPIAS
jgi:hypothetical protein